MTSGYVPLIISKLAVRLIDCVSYSLRFLPFVSIRYDDYFLDELVGVTRHNEI